MPSSLFSRVWGRCPKTYARARFAPIIPHPLGKAWISPLCGLTALVRQQCLGSEVHEDGPTSMSDDEIGESILVQFHFADPIIFTPIVTGHGLGRCRALFRRIRGPYNGIMCKRFDPESEIIILLMVPQDTKGWPCMSRRLEPLERYIHWHVCYV